MRSKLHASYLVIAAACLSAGGAWAQHGSHTMVMPSDLKWVDVPALPPGAKIAVLEGKMSEAGPITARLKFPANYRLPPHHHPGLERVTVLSGTMNFGMGDKLEVNKTTAVSAGGFLIMPPGMNHYVWTKEEAIAQINVTGPWTVTYVNPADDPRKKK
jgi:mannose-6-phosphate isomerase-like protein (cupin superfamily)